MPGYVTYTDPTGKATATLVRKNIAATHHLTSHKGCEHTLIDVHSSSTKKKENLFVLNTCCRTCNKKPGIQNTIKGTLNQAKEYPTLILGDFTVLIRCGGADSTPRRKRKSNIIDQNRLTLFTSLTWPPGLVLEHHTIVALTCSCPYALSETPGQTRK